MFICLTVIYFHLPYRLAQIVVCRLLHLCQFLTDQLFVVILIFINNVTIGELCFRISEWIKRFTHDA